MPTGRMAGGSSPPDLAGITAASLIASGISESGPFMVSRFGANELEALRCGLNFRRASRTGPALRGYVERFGRRSRYSASLRKRMFTNAGFFPSDEAHLDRFVDRILGDISGIDVLGSWLPGESDLSEYMGHATSVPLPSLEPYLSDNPWSVELRGQSVLVVHPFAESIKSQFRMRERLFSNRDVLPEFSLSVFPAVQSVAGNPTRFRDWFEALAWMENEISCLDFDVAIIGAGAYGMPLAAYVKRMGRKSIHLGGATQLLFGIMGKRWEDLPQFRRLMNEYWVRPGTAETPENFLDVESGCYW
jgi:hypothetical protein